MAEQTGVALPAVAFFTASGVGSTGLAVLVDGYRYTSTGGATQIASSAVATEIGGGVYGYTAGSSLNTLEGLYSFVFRTTSSVDSKQIVSGWEVGQGGVEDLDAKISSRAVAGATVTVSGPTAQDGTVEIFQRTDYLLAHGTNLSWSSTSWAYSTSDTAQLIVRGSTGNAIIAKAGTVAATSISIDLTATGDLASVPVGDFEAQIQLTRASDGAKEIPVDISEFTILQRLSTA